MIHVFVSFIMMCSRGYKQIWDLKSVECKALNNFGKSFSLPLFKKVQCTFDERNV